MRSTIDLHPTTTRRVFFLALVAVSFLILAALA